MGKKLRKYKTLLCPEILENILKYADGQTLLTCKEVSPQFRASVDYLGLVENIWEVCYSEEKERYPYDIIEKITPHEEGLNFRKNWGIIYERSFLSTKIINNEWPQLKQIKVGKLYSDIQDVEIHEDLILILLKYNKDFSIFYKIITINLQNAILGKSSRFSANMVYLTPIEDTSKLKQGILPLSCDYCDLMGVPVCADETLEGFPKFSRVDNFLKVEHSHGEVLWINNFGRLLTKGKCFHAGRDAKHEELKEKDSKCLKVFQSFTSLLITCGETKREFNTFRYLKASVTASLYYSNVLFLGTDTGMLYAFKIDNESDLKELDLEAYCWHYNVCSNNILCINVMELGNQVVFVCGTEKNLYCVYVNRKLQNF